MSSKQQIQRPLESVPRSTADLRGPAHLPPARAANDVQRGLMGVNEAAPPAPTFVALTDLPSLRAAGIAYPSTVHGWRWLFRHRHERGLDDAFRRIGRRIVVDPQRYRELVRRSPGA